jgi:hypothetical protein
VGHEWEMLGRLPLLVLLSRGIVQRLASHQQAAVGESRTGLGMLTSSAKHDRGV